MIRKYSALYLMALSLVCSSTQAVESHSKKDLTFMGKVAVVSGALCSIGGFIGTVSSTAVFIITRKNLHAMAQVDPEATSIFTTMMTIQIGGSLAIAALGAALLRWGSQQYSHETDGHTQCCHSKA